MRRLFLAGLPVLALNLAQADEALTPEEMTQTVRLESVTIPMPGEFFAAIDKQGRPAWSQLLRTGAPAPTDSRAQIALGLGTLVADGYIAVEAEDSQGVKNLGKEIINSAKKLNVSQSVLGRGSSINDFASNSDWSALREELEATQNEVKLDMADQKDTSLVTLVTLGAWLRGTDLISGLVDKSYTPEGARLLRQPAIIDYLLQQVGSLPESLQKDALIVSIKSALEKSRTLVGAQTPSAQDIKELHAAMSAVVKSITSGPTES